MHTIAITPHKQAHSGILPAGIVITVVTALLLIYAFYNLSTGHFVVLTLLTGMVIALFHRIGNINSIDAEDCKKMAGKACSDGGSFRYQKTDHTKSDTPSMIRDGGSFKHSLSELFTSH